MDTNPLAGAMREAQLCREELDIALRQHLVAALRGDKAQIAETRDKALTAFYKVTSANETAAHQIRKLEGR